MLLRQLFDLASNAYTPLPASGVGREAILIDPVKERARRYLTLLSELVQSWRPPSICSPHGRASCPVRRSPVRLAGGGRSCCGHAFPTAPEWKRGCM